MKLALALCWWTRCDVPGKRDAVIMAKEMLTDRHCHHQTSTHEKLSSLSSPGESSWDCRDAGRSWEQGVAARSMEREAKMHLKSEEQEPLCRGTTPVHVRTPLCRKGPSTSLCFHSPNLVAPEMDHCFYCTKLRSFHSAPKTSLPMVCSVPDHPAATLG